MKYFHFLENRVSTNPTQLRTCYVFCRSFWLCEPLENFLDKLSACSGYVSCSPNSGLSNGTKIITRGSLEKNRYAYFKKRSPHRTWIFSSKMSKSKMFRVPFSEHALLDSFFCNTFSLLFFFSYHIVLTPWLIATLSPNSAPSFVHKATKESELLLFFLFFLHIVLILYI